MVEKISDFLSWASQNPVLLKFIERDLMAWILISLLFGFITLLIELHLPLQYYWNLPTHALFSLLEGLGLSRKTPVWGYCLDRESKQIIPVAAVELINPDTKERAYLTYSNRLGQFGFKPTSGKYYLRAIKNYYQSPSLLDPENLQLVEIKESYTQPIAVSQLPANSPQSNLELQPIEKIDPHNPKQKLYYFIKNLTFALGNSFLGLGIVASLAAWAITKGVTFGILLAVSIILLFIKIYILETIGRVTTSAVS
ncbi:hypothetical protein KKB83_01695 [Patescibacteria group bacterium]|nr:hypothetical protein [Patescibacteria group bacterium]